MPEAAWLKPSPEQAFTFGLFPSRSYHGEELIYFRALCCPLKVHQLMCTQREQCRFIFQGNKPALRLACPAKPSLLSHHQGWPCKWCHK